MKIFGWSIFFIIQLVLLGGFGAIVSALSSGCYADDDEKKRKK